MSPSSRLSGTTNYGASGGIRGYSVGTTSCNVGDTPLNWCDNSGGCGAGTTERRSSGDRPEHLPPEGRPLHPDRRQLAEARLRFYSTAALQVAATAVALLPRWAATSSASAAPTPTVRASTASRPLGRRSEVNPTTGVFPFPEGGGGSTATVWNQRAAVAEADLDAALNPEARYFIEGHYIAPDDAQSGNGLNNASYREVTVEAGTFNLLMSGSTVRAEVGDRSLAGARSGRRAGRRRRAVGAGRALPRRAQGDRILRPASGTTSTPSTT